MRLHPHHLALALGLGACRSRPAGSPRAPAPIPADRTRELAPRAQAVHVLNRLAFGPRPGQVDQVVSVGIDAWIADQLRLARHEDPAVATLRRAYRTLDEDPAELRAEFPTRAVLRRVSGAPMTAADSVALRQAAREARTVTQELLSARVARAVVSERQLDEVMTDFWLNHFSVFAGKNPSMRYTLAAYEREAIRPHALGRFRDLLGAVAKSPAMLTYLDNASSVADSTRPTLGDRNARERRVRRARAALAQRGGRRATRGDTLVVDQLLARRPKGLNENYARELLELHTLGVDGGYTQQDVIEVARALTGWTVQRGPRGTGGFTFNAVAHDAGAKVILGHPFPAGRGVAEGEAVLDLVARHPATARHIARKLVVRFVSDSAHPALVERAAEVFRRTDGDLREVVRTIVTSPEFFSRAAWRAKVKSPFELVVSAARALGAGPDTTGATAAVVARLGQPIYGHQAPDGWPETGAAWMNTGAILARINFGMAVAANRVPGARPSAWPPAASLRSAPRDAQVDAVVAALLGGDASPETREILASGAHPMLDDAGRSSLRALTGLDQVVGLAIGAPEFQRR